jgi:hypothetical protein
VIEFGLASFFLNRIQQSPDAFMMACMVWIPVTVWIFLMLSWTLSGAIEASYGVFALIAGLLVGILVTRADNPQTSVALGFGAYGMVIAVPFMRYMLTRKLIRSIDLEQLERHYFSLGSMPGNIAAKYQVAKGAWELGYLGHAVKLGEEALTGASVDVFRREIAELEQWRRTVEPKHFREIECLTCRAKIQPGMGAFCPRCGAPYLLEVAQGGSLASDKRRVVGRMAGLVTAGVLALSLVPAVLTAGGLEQGVRIGLAVGLSLAAIGVGMKALLDWLRDRT